MPDVVPPFQVAIRTWNDPFLALAVASVRGLRGATGVVIVDDGSTPPVDATRLDAGALPVRVVRQANAGAPAARNRAIEECREEWVVLLDSDDELLPAVSDAVAAAARAESVGAACGRLFIKDGQVERTIEPPEDWVRSGLPSEQCAFTHHFPIFSPSGFVVRRSAGIQAGERCDLSINLAEDRLFAYHLRRLGPLLVFRRPTARINVHDSAAGRMTSHENVERNVSDMLRLHDALYTPEADSVWRDFLLYWAGLYARHGRNQSTWSRIGVVADAREWDLPWQMLARFQSRKLLRAVGL